MYAKRKEWPLAGVRVELDLAQPGKAEAGAQISREIHLEGPLDAEQRERLLQIANACPVHKLLSNPISIATGQPLVGPPVALTGLSALELVMPSRPHSIRMLLETALVAQGVKPRVGIEIESVPAILDLVADGAGAAGIGAGGFNGGGGATAGLGAGGRLCRHRAALRR